MDRARLALSSFGDAFSEDFFPEVIPRSIQNFRFGLCQSPGDWRSQMALYWVNTIPFAIADPRELSHEPKSKVLDRARYTAALSQEYVYVGRGRQCYAFASEDGKYILKLPRSDRYRVPFWLRACSWSFLDAYRDAERADRKQRLEFLLESFQIAFHELKGETALLYLHLDAKKTWNQKICVRDRLGRSCVLDVDKTAFVLQKKVPLFAPIFRAALAQGKRHEAEQILRALRETVSIRARKGIFNKDPTFLKNIGYDEGRCVQIDVGSFYRKDLLDPSEAAVRSFSETMQHVHTWLQGLDPEMADWFRKDGELGP